MNYQNLLPSEPKERFTKSISVRNQKIESACRGFFCEAIIDLVFAVLFRVYLSKPEYYAGTLCSQQMLDISKIYYYLQLVKALNFALLLCIAVYFIIKNHEVLPNFIAMYANGSRILFGFASVVIWIFLIVAYEKHNQCADLGVLVLVVIILNGIGIGLLACCGCCLGCLMLLGKK